MHTDRSVCIIMSDTREYIIDQSYRLFLSRSYEAVSISDISKAIGFTKGALYHHFTNKEELFMAVIDKYLPLDNYFLPMEDMTLKEYIDRSVETAEKIVNSILTEENSFLPLSYISLLIDAFRHYPKFSKEQDLLFQREIDRVKVVIKNAIKNGEIKSNINVDMMALNFFSLGLGIASNLLMNSTPKQAIDTLRKQLLELYKLMKS